MDLAARIDARMHWSAPTRGHWAGEHGDLQGAGLRVFGNDQIAECDVLDADFNRAGDDLRQLR